jgi:hypothetical protein
MPIAWSRLPGARKIFAGLDRRYARNRAFGELQDRVRLLEYMARSQDGVSALGQALADILVPVPSTHSLKRYGTAGDGGYILAEDLLDRETIISLGVGSDVSADEDLATRGHHVFQFDPTIPCSPSNHANIEFFRVGITGMIDVPQMERLKDLLLLANVSAGEEYCLLMDVEGAEWDVLSDPSTDLSRCRQLGIELHALELVAAKELQPSMLAALSKLGTDFVCISAHANNFASGLHLGGFFIPSVAEFTFVRRDLFNSATAPPSRTLQAAISPNDPHWRDLPQGDLFRFVPPLPGEHCPSAKPWIRSLAGEFHGESRAGE